MMAKEELNNKKILLEEVNSYKIKKKKDKIKAKLRSLFKVDARVRSQSNMCNAIFYHGTSKPLISKIIFDDDDGDVYNSDDTENEEILENISKNIFTWKQKQLQFKESEINDSVDSIVIEDEDDSQSLNNSEKIIHKITSNILNKNISKYQAEKIMSTNEYDINKEIVNVIKNMPQNLNSVVNNSNLNNVEFEIPLINHEKDVTSNILIEVLHELPQTIESSINSEIDNNKKYICSNNVQSHKSLCNAPTEDKTHNNIGKFPRMKSTNCRNLPKYSGKMASMAKNISRKTQIINKNILSQKIELNNEQHYHREPIKIKEKDNNESSMNFPRTKITGRRNIPKYSGKMASMMKHNSKVPKNHPVNDNKKSCFDVSLKKSFNYLSLYITTIMLAYIKLNRSNNIEIDPVQTFLEIRNKYFTLSYPIVIKHYSIIKKDKSVLKILLKLAYINLNKNKHTCYYSEKLFCDIFNDILKQVEQSHQPPINNISNPEHLSSPGNIENSICNILTIPFIKNHEQQNNLNNTQYLKNIINCPTIQKPHSSNMSSQNSSRSLLDNSVIAPTVEMPNALNICNMANSSHLHMKESTMCPSVKMPNLSIISSQTKVNHMLPQCQQNLKSTKIQNKYSPTSLLTPNAYLSSGWYDESYQLHHKISQKNTQQQQNPQYHNQQERIPQCSIQQQVIPQKHIQQQRIHQYHTQQERIQQYPIQQQRISNHQYHNQQEKIPQYPIQQQRIPQYPFQQQRILQYPFQQKTVPQYPLQQESMLQFHHPTATKMYSIPLGIIPESQDMARNYSPNINIEISSNKDVGTLEQNKCIRSISRDSGIMSPSNDGIMAECEQN